jgi:hypothetical protein
MKFWDIEQRTEAWYTARLGKPTASQFGRIIGQRTLKDGVRRYIKEETSKGYEAELIAERIFKRPFGRDLSRNEAVQYGVEHEPDAIRHLAREVGHDILHGGFFTTDDGRLGCSPDGRIFSDNSRELVEIKCPQIPQQIKTLVYGIEGSDYWEQLQGQLFITGFDMVHFLSWRHDCPPYYAKVEPDLAYHRDLARLLDEFCRRLDENESVARLAGLWPEAPQ